MTDKLSLPQISPVLADILATVGTNSADPAGIEAFTSEWLISELMRDDPSLTREQAIALIREAEIEAEAAGLMS